MYKENRKIVKEQFKSHQVFNKAMNKTICELTETQRAHEIDIKTHKLQ